MRQILIVAFVANLILMAVSVALSPEQVAIHFGGGGVPDSWASREFNAAIFLVLEVPFFLLFYFSHMMTRGVPSRFLNIPNKEYWLKEGNLGEFNLRFRRFMAEFGVAIFAFFFCISLLALRANLSDPVRLNERAFMVVFVAYLVYVMVWLVRLVRGLKVPVSDG